MQITKAGLDEIVWNCSFGVAGEAELPLCEQFKGSGHTVSLPAVTQSHILYIHRNCVIHIHIHTEEVQVCFSGNTGSESK